LIDFYLCKKLIMDNNSLKITSDNWPSLSQAWQKSGLSKKAFCKEQNITYACFLYYFRRQSQKEAPSASKFLPIQVLNQTPKQDLSNAAFSIVYPNHCELKIHQMVDMDTLSKLLGLCK